MKVFVFLTLISLAVAIEYYVTLDDYLDLDVLFADTPRIKEYVNCYLDKGPCAPLPASYKRLIPEALEQACRRCSPAQKSLFWGFMQRLSAQYPTYHEEFVNKYDPENKYREALIREISKY